jgi:uncharacterized protein with PQ loop repeat
VSDTSNQAAEPEQNNEPTAPAKQQTQIRERKRFDFTTLNTLAVVSLATALSSIGAVAAIITGHISLAQIKRSGESGRAMAIIGLVLGYLTVAGWIIFGILAVVAKAFIYRDFMGLQPMNPGWFDFFELNRMGHMFDR